MILWKSNIIIISLLVIDKHFIVTDQKYHDIIRCKPTVQISNPHEYLYMYVHNQYYLIDKILNYLTLDKIIQGFKEMSKLEKSCISYLTNAKQFLGLLHFLIIMSTNQKIRRTNDIALLYIAIVITRTGSYRIAFHESRSS